MASFSLGAKSILLTIGLAIGNALVGNVNEVYAQQQDYVSVSYRNDSNMTVKLGVRMLDGAYRWDDLAPGETGRATIRVNVFRPLIDRSQSIEFAVRVGRNPARTQKIPVRVAQYGLLWASAKVIRRSPGIPGIVDSSGR